MKTIKELEAEISGTSQEAQYYRNENRIKKEALEEVLELIDEKIEYYDIKLDTKAQVCLIKLKARIQG